MQTAPSRLVLIVLLSGLCMANIDLAIVNVAAPSIRDTLGASGAQLQLVVSTYVISYAMLLIVGARLGQGDRGEFGPSPGRPELGGRE